MKNLVSCTCSVLVPVAGAAGSGWLVVSLASHEPFKSIVLCLGYLSMSFLVLLVGSGLGYLRAQRLDQPAQSDLTMPMLRPIPIPTSGRSLLGRLVAWLHDVRKWEVAENWEYTLPTDGARIVIHGGFRFDGASIPRFLWAILSPTGLLLVQGLIHDYGYRYGQLWEVQDNGTVRPYAANASKAEWDRLFRQTGGDVNGMTVVNFAAWLAVYLGGWSAWRKNRKKNAQPVIPNGMSLAAVQPND